MMLRKRMPIEEAQVADAGDDESLLRRPRRLRLLVPEADQQVGAQAHELPAMYSRMKLSASTRTSMEKENSER